MTEDKNTSKQATEEKTVPQDNGPELTVQDLNAIKTIIDVASSRGAFKPNEMMTVGQTYQKLDAFLSAVTNQAQNSTQGA